MKTLTLLFSLLVILNSSCTSKTDSIADLQTSVIEVHDEVMPKMDKIMSLSSEIKQLKSDTSQVLPSDQLILANNLIVDLEKASESMMNWMRNYDSMMTGMEDEEKISYLKKQQTEIQQVKQEMLSAISSASTFVENQKDL